MVVLSFPVNFQDFIFVSIVKFETMFNFHMFLLPQVYDPDNLRNLGNLFFCVFFLFTTCWLELFLLQSANIIFERKTFYDLIRHKKVNNCFFFFNIIASYTLQAQSKIV